MNSPFTPLNAVMSAAFASKAQPRPQGRPHRPKVDSFVSPAKPASVGQATFVDAVLAQSAAAYAVLHSSSQQALQDFLDALPPLQLFDPNAEDATQAQPRNAPGSFGASSALLRPI